MLQRYRWKAKFEGKLKNARLKLENEILKKATAYFARDVQ
jgi:transposase-like protein